MSKNITYKNKRFIFNPNEFIQRDEYDFIMEIPGTKYDKKSKIISAPWWSLDDVMRVARIYEYQIEDYRQRIGSQIYDRISGSKTESGHNPMFEPEDKKYLPFQAAGIVEALRRNPDILLADEMGLGKTIQAIGILNNIVWGKVLIVCPASLRTNWKQEFMEWSVDDNTIEIPNSTFKTGDVTIINYDKLSKFAAELNCIKFDVAIFDESHYLKSPKAKRTKLCFGAKKVIHAGRRIFLTGTPILNRPIEIFPLLRELGIEDNWKRYTRLFCDAKEKTVWRGYGKKSIVLDVSGSSNEDKLQKILRSTIMIRRMKKDVLKQLPDKIQQIVFLPENGGLKGIKKERLEFAETLKNPNLALALSSLSELRQENALRKVKFVKEYVDNILEQKQKVVIFAWHKVVIAELMDALKIYKPLSITGDTKPALRQGIVEEFQTGDSRVIIGNIQAMGSGLTLTAASDVVFVEMDWTPGNNTQAEDRIHRIGQDDTCHIHYLVYADTVDAFIAKKVAGKKKVIEKILDEVK